MESAGRGWTLRSNEVYAARNDMHEIAWVLADAYDDAGADPAEPPGQAKVMQKLTLRLKDCWQYHDVQLDRLWAALNGRMGPRFQRVSEFLTSVMPVFEFLEYQSPLGPIRGDLRAKNGHDPYPDLTFSGLVVQHHPEPSGPVVLEHFRRFIEEKIQPPYQLLYGHPSGFLSNPGRSERHTIIQGDIVSALRESKEEHGE